MLHFLVLWDEKDTSQISSICKFEDLGNKKTVLYIPEKVWDGYGGEFLHINIRSFPNRLIQYAEKYHYRAGNFLIVKDYSSLSRLLNALYKIDRVGCVIGISENLMRYIYASKERSYINKRKDSTEEGRKNSLMNLRRIRMDIISELANFMHCENFPVIVLWLGYEFIYKGEKKQKIYLYRYVKDLGVIHSSSFRKNLRNDLQIPKIHAFAKSQT